MAARWLIAGAAVLVAVLGIWLLVVVRSAVTAGPPPRDNASSAPTHTTADAAAAVAPPPSPTPALTAPPPPPPHPPRPSSHPSAARTIREHLISKVRSGPESHDPWTTAATALLDRIAIASTDTADRGCFATSCLATYTFVSDAAYREAVAAWRANPDVKAWTGSISYTDPEARDDGSVVVAIVLDHAN